MAHPPPTTRRMTGAVNTVQRMPSLPYRELLSVAPPWVTVGVCHCIGLHGTLETQAISKGRWVRGLLIHPFRNKWMLGPMILENQ